MLHRWFLEGSDAAAGETLRQARTTLSAKAYRAFLESFFTGDTVPGPIRLAALILELGEQNRAERPANGVGEINTVLFEMTMTADEELMDVAILAVGEICTVKNTDALYAIAADAPLLPVAEKAVMCMKDLRRLLMVQPVLAQRRELHAAYRKAEGELMTIQHIMASVWTCDNTEIVQLYVDRLIELNAIAELESISKLAQRKGHLNGLRLSGRG